MSSSSPTPSPSSVTPTTSPQLSSTHHRGSRRGIAQSDEEVDTSLNTSISSTSPLNDNLKSNPSFSLTPPATINSSFAEMPAAPMGNAGASSSSAFAGGMNDLTGIGGGKSGFSMTTSKVPTSSSSSSSAINHKTSRMPPYFGDVASIGATSGARAPPLTMGDKKERAGHRKRSSSIVVVEKIEQSHEELLDQSAGFNANADWVNYKGAWVIHVVLIMLGKILVDVVPGMEQDTSWTIVNVGYIAISFLMFHYVTGTPFESNAGVYDKLTLWEQIDEGAQYTPAKKWLTSVPIGLFLISTHYTRYNPFLFGLNFFALLFVLFPKLPILHRLRFKVKPFAPHSSLPPTPTHSRPPSAAGFR
ncbi:hypothetical protein CBS101457_004416 [Exobasidium rhododendri]|nr:hypothetical protein CBS101457_004416 [Exobasidium rhododendri]